MHIVPPPSPAEPSNLPVPLDLDRRALLDVDDPWRRSRIADDLARQLRALINMVLQVRAEAVRELVHQHEVPHARIARHLGVSRARIGQLVAVPTTPATAEAVTG